MVEHRGDLDILLMEQFSQMLLQALTPILLMPMMLFSGFFSNLGTAASWIAWI